MPSYSIGWPPRQVAVHFRHSQRSLSCDEAALRLACQFKAQHV